MIGLTEIDETSFNSFNKTILDMCTFMSNPEASNNGFYLIFKIIIIIEWVVFRKN